MMARERVDVASRVLVLDDSEELLDITTMLIERLCHRRTVAVKSLGEIELRQSEALHCALALLDINLGPNQPNGVDVYRWLRAHGFKRPIYFLTGHAQTYPLVAEAERLGDAKVLAKPCPPDELIRIIMTTCASEGADD